MDETTSSGSTWESWIQGVAGKVIGSAADAKYSQPYEIQRLRLQALGDMGYYAEGQPGTIAKTGTVAGIPTGTLLLIGAAVVAVMLLKD
jgi:hypothetical protein